MPSSTEQTEHLQKELNTLRAENQRLQRRKDELEMQLEHANVKEAFNLGKDGRELKIVHLAMNPADEAHENYKNEVDKLRAEVIKLDYHATLSSNSHSLSLHSPHRLND